MLQLCLIGFIPRSQVILYAGRFLSFLCNFIFGPQFFIDFPPYV